MTNNINTIVILAGGLATRIRPITKNVPKSLLSIAGKPFIEHQLIYIKQQNIDNVIVCAGFLGEQIQDHLGDGSQFSISIKYSFDGKILLGTGGALKKAINLLPDQFYLLYGDSFLPIDFKKVQKFYFENHIKDLVTVYKNNNKFDKSNIQFLDNKIIKYDKNNINKNMEYIDYGLSILSKSSIKDFNVNDKFDLGDLFKTLSYKKRLFGLEVFERFYEVGSYEGIGEATKFFSDKKN